jgi:hypothetical protein
MAEPDPRPDPAQRPAERARQEGRTDAGTPHERPLDLSVDQSVDRYADPEAALGGADAVEKTSYVVGDGAEPGAQQRAEVSAQTDTGGGLNIGTWVVTAIVLLIALVYAIGAFR